MTDKAETTIREWMHRVELRGGAYVLRMWAHRHHDGQTERDEQYAHLTRLLDQISPAVVLGITYMKTVEEIALSLPFCSAVEIVDAYGQGLCAYKDWP